MSRSNAQEVSRFKNYGDGNKRPRVGGSSTPLKGSQPNDLEGFFGCASLGERLAVHKKSPSIP